MIEEAKIIERDGKFCRLEGVDGLIVEADLGPCRLCGGRVFRVGKKALYCVKCCKIPKYEPATMRAIIL